MLAALCAGAMVLGVLVGRRSSFLSLLLAAPIAWLSAALALSAAGRPPGLACLSALGPVLAMQIAYFAGAQMRVEAAGTRGRGDEGPSVERMPETSARPREVGLRPLAADDREGRA